MKAAQITKYGQQVEAEINEIATPQPAANEVLIKVSYAAVNPLEQLISSGSVKFIQNYHFPLTIGNELSGVVTAVGAAVTAFNVGDQVYSRLPLPRIGAFAEYVAVAEAGVAKIPSTLDLAHAAAVPLTALTAYQIFNEIISVKPGESVFIPGGSGSFGQLAIPIAKSLGLRVLVSGNAAAEERTRAAGADDYFDYRVANYWEKLTKIDYVIDTLGVKELAHELQIIKPGGTLVSLRMGPNRTYAVANHLPAWKRLVFGMVGRKIDRQARAAGASYRFVFVRSDGAALAKISQLVAARQIVPAIDPHHFTLAQVNEALALVANGRLQGKVLLDLTQG